MDEKLFMIFEWRSFHMSSVVGICSASRTGLYLKQQKKMSRIQKFNTPVVMPLIGHLQYQAS